VVLGVNAAAALVTLAFSAVVLVDPGVALPAGVDVTAGAGFYARACALRSIALAVVLLVVIVRVRTILVPLLVVAGSPSWPMLPCTWHPDRPHRPRARSSSPRCPSGRYGRHAESDRTPGALTWEHDYHDD
jgi:hypothetical protein